MKARAVTLRLALLLGLLALPSGVAGVACSSAPRLPPGLPPPEYEQPEVMAWPPPEAGGASQLEGSPVPGDAAGAQPAVPRPTEPGGAGAPGE